MFELFLGGFFGIGMLALGPTLEYFASIFVACVCCFILLLKREYDDLDRIRYERDSHNCTCDTDSSV